MVSRDPMKHLLGAAGGDFLVLFLGPKVMMLCGINQFELFLLMVKYDIEVCFGHILGRRCQSYLP